MTPGGPPFAPAAFGRVVPSMLPAPPSGSNFPYFRCQHNPEGSRLFLQPQVNITLVEKNYTKMCFTVGVRDVCPQPDSPCCSFSLHKLEFEADPVCARSLVYSTVDGIRRIRFFQYRPYSSIKVTRIGKAFDQAAGTEVCLVLKPECSSLKALGAFHDGTMKIAIASLTGTRPATCCPVFNAQ
ncbi:hypothetical protein PLESTF_000496500 [Pleodorina starrii]|nr:hypothetical protein PLESTM_000723300 [Pleodorina starrii]GLC66963.1 hypothetical protein PLESTF_000496500 [Pleodorina starrii]